MSCLTLFVSGKFYCLKLFPLNSSEDELCNTNIELKADVPEELATSDSNCAIY